MHGAGNSGRRLWHGIDLERSDDECPLQVRILHTAAGVFSPLSDWFLSEFGDRGSCRESAHDLHQSSLKLLSREEKHALATFRVTQCGGG